MRQRHAEGLRDEQIGESDTETLKRLEQETADVTESRLVARQGIQESNNP